MTFLKHPLFIFLGVSFLALSFPFVHYPLTDGDIGNWTPVVQHLLENGLFSGGVHDQGHGPLLAFMTTLFMKVGGSSFYFINFFNLLMGLLIIGLMYFFSKQFFKDEKSVSGLAAFSTYLISTSLMFVYLSRTPMYDWPATACYFAFFGFYTLYIREGRYRDLLIAILAIGLGSMFRFSICIGLGGIFVLLSNLAMRRSLVLLVRDGLMVLGIGVLFNLPWLLSQSDANGMAFIQTFIYDNTGRYIKSTRPNSYYRADFWGFSLYVLMGVMPHTFLLISAFFRKHFLGFLKANRFQLLLLATWLPCLVLFSLSGHTKLGRYIAYVFPGLLLQLGYYVYHFGLTDDAFIKRCKKMIVGTSVFLALLLGVLCLQYSKEAMQSPLFVGSVFGLLFSLLGLSYVTLSRYRPTLLNSAERLLPLFAVFYMVFFLVVAIETPKTPFLESVQLKIERTLGK